MIVWAVYQPLKHDNNQEIKRKTPLKAGICVPQSFAVHLIKYSKSGEMGPEKLR
jgi:hypothetical protein